MPAWVAEYATQQPSDWRRVTSGFRALGGRCEIAAYRLASYCKRRGRSKGINTDLSHSILSFWGLQLEQAEDQWQELLFSADDAVEFIQVVFEVRIIDFIPTGRFTAHQQ